MNFSDYKNIIFDFGGVVLDIDVQKAADMFRQMGITNHHYFVKAFENGGMLYDFQQGKATAQEFRDEIRRITRQNYSDEKIDKAWNAMLLNSSPERVQLLQKLKLSHRTFLLSNTNEIHCSFFGFYFQKNFNVELSNLFEKTYFSHDLGMSKPDSDIYEYVIQQHGLVCSETLFIDDTLENVQTAANFGMGVIHLTAPRSILDFA